MLALLEDRADEGCLRALWTDLDKDARAIGPHLLDHGDKFDRSGNLMRELVADLGDRLRVVTARDVGQDRCVRDLDIDGFEVAAQRLAGSGDDLGVERVADGEQHDLHPLLLEVSDDALHGLGEASDDGLARRVLVGADDVSGLELFELGLDLCGADRNAGHQAAVAVHGGRRRHLGATRRDRAERLFERHHASGDASAILAEAVPGDDIRRDAKLTEQAPERHVHGEHCGLCDLGLTEREERLHLVDLAEIRVNQITQVAPEHRRHHAICFLEGLADDGVALGQVGEHPEVLRSLTGEQHGGATARGELTGVEHALVREHAPPLPFLERLDGALEALRQLLGSLEDNRQALFALRERGERGVLDREQTIGDGRDPARVDIRQRSLGLGQERSSIGSAHGEHALIPGGCAGGCHRGSL